MPIGTYRSLGKKWSRLLKSGHRLEKSGYDVGSLPLATLQSLAHETLARASKVALARRGTSRHDRFEPP